MRAVRYYGFGECPKIEEVADPVAGQNEVVVRVKACQLGTDVLKIMAGTGPVQDSAGYIFPHTPGYRGAGVVESVNSGNPTLKPGDRVIVNGFVHCNTCDDCEHGRDNLCSNARLLGVDSGASGALAEKFKAPDYAVFKLPDAVSYSQATLFSNIGLLVHALERAAMRPGFTAAILGCGLVGSCAIPVVRAYGAAQIIGVDMRESALELAERCGADEIIAGDSTDAVEAILEKTDGRGVDVAFEIVGNSSTIQQAIQSTANRGVTILLGALKEVSLSFPNYYNEIIRREIDLKACYGKTRDDFAMGLKLANEGLLDLTPYSFQEYDLDAIESAVEAAQDPGNNSIHIITM